MNSLMCPIPETVVIQVFPDGHEMRLDLLHRVQARIPQLDPNRDYSLKEICGEDVWASSPKYHRIQAGITVAHLVTTGKLPLAFTTCPHAVPKRYRLK